MVCLLWLSICLEQLCCIVELLIGRLVFSHAGPKSKVALEGTHTSKTSAPRELRASEDLHISRGEEFCGFTCPLATP